MFIPFILSVKTLRQIKPLATLQGAKSEVPGMAWGRREETQFLHFAFHHRKRAMRRNRQRETRNRSFGKEGSGGSLPGLKVGWAPWASPANPCDQAPADEV